MNNFHHHFFTQIPVMSSQRSQRSQRSLKTARSRRSSITQNDYDDQESLDERIKEVAQSVLAGHARKGGLKNIEATISNTLVKKALKDAVHISEKQMKEVLGCKLTKDSDRISLSYLKKIPLAAQGSADIISEAKQGLLSVVLMFIHMTKNPLVKTDKVKEMALWEFLELLEVNQTAIHPVFGLPSKLIAPSNAAEFVSQGWLSFEKKQTERNDSEEIVYDWGPRAYAIISPHELLETFCEINGDEATDWKEHYKIGKNEDVNVPPPPPTQRKRTQSQRMKRETKEEDD
ncbi:hypothetical protein PRIPAC_82230 [Pristionchus pacificus]|uniref:MAGE domain-containing protein n=1 Tax=Pristionchus pacificus TaxID=54126 RepID=A0A2A6C2G8_PRIPA|nr:hypothetical protein PRIPAC_82230 [Pristionchus pacificus]|eukprot:PDM72221.1 hypothetical protein PRIPAC_38655 [Pristionchus pacificus]